MAKVDVALLVGQGVVTKWEPDHLLRKDEIAADLVAQGYEGAALEHESLAVLAARGIKPYDITSSLNTLTTNGCNILLTALTGGTPVFYTNALAALGVGDSSAAFALGQTNLQGAVVTTDRIRKAMNATFPSVVTNVATFQSTFATTEANYVWNEWGLFNNITDASGTMLNRAVANLGTKTSASAFQLTVTLSLS